MWRSCDHHCSLLAWHTGMVKALKNREIEKRILKKIFAQKIFAQHFRVFFVCVCVFFSLFFFTFSFLNIDTSLSKIPFCELSWIMLLQLFLCNAISFDDCTSPFSPLLLSTFPSQFILLHIFNHSYLTPTASHQARMELRRLKQEVRNKHAVTVIWAYWQGTKVFPPSCSVAVPAVLSPFTMFHPILTIKAHSGIELLLNEYKVDELCLLCWCFYRCLI